MWRLGRRGAWCASATSGSVACGGGEGVRGHGFGRGTSRVRRLRAFGVGRLVMESVLGAECYSNVSVKERLLR